MNAIQRFPAPLPKPFSTVVRAGGFLFLSGVLPTDEQGKLVAGLADVVRITVWLADLGEFAAFNDEYRRHFELGYPARSTVQAALYGGARIEIEAQALVPQVIAPEGGGS